MTMTGRLRKFSLAAHVVSSVGWLGAVVTSLALAITGLVSSDIVIVRAVDLSMELIGWTVLVPLSLASLFTGLLQALGTRWGLLRHYWVLIKLLINMVASVVLLLYMRTLSALADRATRASTSGDLGSLADPSPLVHSSAALLLLLVATALSVYKPAGLTRYGQRKQHERQRVDQHAPTR